MWKIIWILLVFNTRTNKFEQTNVETLNTEVDKLLIEHATGITEMKHEKLKFIKVIQDSIYIPDDSCYSEYKKGEMQYLKFK